MNDENLRPFNKMDPDEHKAISAKGGKASGVARQQRRQLKDELTALLSSGDVQERVCLGLIQKAEQGDPRAFAILRDTLGERLPDGMSIELSGRSADLTEWKNEHKDELLQLWLLDLDSGEDRYKGLWSLLSYEDRKRLFCEITVDP